MTSWYYVDSKTHTKCGPHSEADVRALYISGELHADALVWHEGLAGWIPAAQAFAALQTPSGTTGNLPLPDGLRGWMTFVGMVSLLGAIVPALFLWGLPLLLAAIAILRASSVLARTPYVTPDMLPFLSRLRTAFCCWGWFYILAFFFFLLILLGGMAATFCSVSSAKIMATEFLSTAAVP